MHKWTAHVPHKCRFLDIWTLVHLCKVGPQSFHVKPEGLTVGCQKSRTSRTLGPGGCLDGAIGRKWTAQFSP